MKQASRQYNSSEENFVSILRAYPLSSTYMTGQIRIEHKIDLHLLEGSIWSHLVKRIFSQFENILSAKYIVQQSVYFSLFFSSSYLPGER